jgi:surface antigen
MRHRCGRWKSALQARRFRGASQIPGEYGNVVPGPAYELNGVPCRQYTSTMYIDGRPQTERGTACRKPDGTWMVVS